MDNPSADNGQTIIVKEGDTWATLSNGHYGSPGYADLLAEYNGLNKFRQPIAGSNVTFPPLTDI